MSKGHGSDANPIDGDRVTMDVDLSGGVVSVVKAEAHGCDSIGLIVRALETLVHRSTEDRAWLVDVAAIRRAMGAMSEDNERCALSAIGALRAALVDAHVRARAAGQVKT